MNIGSPSLLAVPLVELRPGQNPDQEDVSPLFFKFSDLTFKSVISGLQLANIQAPLPGIRIAKTLVTSLYKNVYSLRIGKLQNNLSLDHLVGKNFDQVATFFGALSQSLQFGVESIRLIDKYTINKEWTVIGRATGLFNGSIRDMDELFSKVLGIAGEAENLFSLLAAVDEFLKLDSEASAQVKKKTYLRLGKGILDAAASAVGITFGVRAKAAVGVVSGVVGFAKLWMETRAASSPA